MRVRQVDDALRQWWADPGDYRWLIEHLDARGLLGVLKAAIGAFGVIMAVLVLLMETSPTVSRSVSSRAFLGFLTLVGIAWALLWWMGPWPSVRRSYVLVAVGDVSIGLGCLLHSDALASVSGTPLFAVLGAYVALFHNAKVHACHAGWAAIFIAGVAVRMSLQHWPQSLALGMTRTIIALLVGVAVLPVLQFVVWTLQHSSAEALADPLTGLANRRGLDYAVRPLATHRAQLRVCAIVIDLDRFKAINDTYGHAVGDEVLVRTAKRIRGCIRTEAVVARLGGEEFLVLDRAGPHGVLIAERIRAAIAAPAYPAITASIGVAVADSIGKPDMDCLLKAADAAMYAAKQHGGNTVVIAGQHH